MESCSSAVIPPSLYCVRTRFSARNSSRRRCSHYLPDRPRPRRLHPPPRPTSPAHASPASQRVSGRVNGGNYSSHCRRQGSIPPRDHPHQLPRLCCPHAVQCDAFRYVLLQPIPWDPARACLAGYRAIKPRPRPDDARFLGYSSESCGYCKDASNGRRTANSSRCIFLYFYPILPPP